MNKTILTMFAVLMLIMGAFLAYSHTASIGGPTGTVYVTDKTNVTHSFEFTTTADACINVSGTMSCKTEPMSQIENITFWSDNTTAGTLAFVGTNYTLVTNTSTGNFNFSSTGWTKDRVVSWNAKVGNRTNSQSWLFSTNNSYLIDYVQVNNMEVNYTTNAYVETQTPGMLVTVIASDEPITCKINNGTIIAGGDLRQFNNILNNTAYNIGGPSAGWNLEKGTNTLVLNCTSRINSDIWNSSLTWNMKVDTDTPTVTVNSPTDNGWSAERKVLFSITPSDIYPSSCDLWGNFTSSNSTLWALNQTNSSVTNGSAVLFEVAIPDSYTSNGGIKWGYRCNDSFGHRVVANLTLYVDNLTMDNSSCMAPVNGSRSTDYSPKLEWTANGDLGFDRYTISIFNTSLAVKYKYNVTTNSTTSYEIADTLSNDTVYYWNVSVFDKAGHQNGTDNCQNGFYYKTDATGHSLKSGYNIYSMVQNNTVREVCSSISTTPTSISIFNWSHAWVTHVCGTATNVFDLARDDAIVINMPGTGLWENNRTWTVRTFILLNITNNSGPWNLVGVFNDTTLLAVDMGNKQHNNTVHGLPSYVKSNYSVPFFSYANHSNVYIPFKNNWTVNGATAIEDGDALWLKLDPTVALSMQINRSLW